MSLVLPKKDENNFEQTPAGVYTAACYRVIDLGTQEKEYMGEKKNKHLIMLSWELHSDDVKMADGRPFSMHKRYTLSSNDKSQLRKDLEAWRGVPFTDNDFGTFEFSKLIGKACMMQIVHHEDKGNVYANISSIMKLPKGMPAPSLAGEPIYYAINEHDEAVFAKLSDSLKQTIMKSPEFIEATKPGTQKVAEYIDSEIPY